jgi:hypothetical protein
MFPSYFYLPSVFRVAEVSESVYRYALYRCSVQKASDAFVRSEHRERCKCSVCSVVSGLDTQHAGVWEALLHCHQLSPEGQGSNVQQHGENCNLNKCFYSSVPVY